MYKLKTYKDGKVTNVQSKFLVNFQWSKIGKMHSHAKATKNEPWFHAIIYLRTFLHKSFHDIKAN
jgi:hypothetical protein